MVAHFASMTCAVCGGRFAGNPANVPSVDAEARITAVKAVDERLGYTIEEAPDRLAHSQAYDTEERKLHDETRREPVCSICIQFVNEQRVKLGLEPWFIFPDSYGVVEGIHE